MLAVQQRSEPKSGGIVIPNTYAYAVLPVALTQRGQAHLLFHDREHIEPGPFS